MEIIEKIIKLINEPIISLAFLTATKVIVSLIAVMIGCFIVFHENDQPATPLWKWLLKLFVLLAVFFAAFAFIVSF